jgi:hypothetical protein
MITREEALRRRLAQLEAMEVTPVYDEAGRMIDLRMDEGDMPDNLAASATPIAVDPDVKITSLGRRVVGPRTATGNAPVPGEYFQSEDEAEAYYNRGIDPKTGDVIASGADEGMLERGFRPVYKADGTVGYAVAADGEGMSKGAGGAETMNRREQDRLRATGYWENSEPGKTPGPLGASTAVLVPTQANRQYNADLAERQSVNRFIGRTGMDPEAARGMSRDQRRDALDGQRAQDLYARKQRMRSEREFAGGSQNINSGNAMEIRQLVAMDPTRREELMADNMGPRNVQYRFNPRTGQVEFGSQRAYPPSENADARSLEMMMRENARRELVNQQREQSLIPLRAEVQRLASADGWGNAGLPRAEARRRLIASGLYPADLIDLALDEAYGRGAPDAATIPEGVVPDSPVDPTPSLVPMPGPDGAGTGMPYNYRY